MEEERVIVADLGFVVVVVVEEEGLVVAVDDVVDDFLAVVVVEEVVGLESVALTTVVADLEAAAGFAAAVVFELAARGFEAAADFEGAGFAGAVFATGATFELAADFAGAAVDFEGAAGFERVVVDAGFARVADFEGRVFAKVGFAAAGFALTFAVVAGFGFGIFEGIVADFEELACTGDFCAFSSQKVARGERRVRGASDPAANAMGALRGGVFAAFALRVVYIRD